MSEQKKGLLSVHVAMIFLGVAGLFAKIIHQPGVLIALGRVVFSSLFLFGMFRVRKIDFRLKERKEYISMVIAGVILAAHWTCFMTSIQISTVAIGTLTFSTFSLFVTFLEPWLYHEKLKLSSVISAIVMMIGVVFIVPEFKLENQMTMGVIIGMLSSFTYAIFSLMNRSFSSKYAGPVISFYEQGTAAICLLPAFFYLKPVMTPTDWFGLVVLGVVFTAGAHSLYISGLKTVKVQTASIISSLESVYSIVAAMILLHEMPSAKEWIGGIIILGVVFYSTYLSVKAENEKETV